MSTFSGRRIYINDPRPDDFEIIDIAHGLSNTTRYSGQCLSFFSVAEHCIRGSKRASEAEELTDYTHPELKLAYEFLMHDASEAYLGDMVHPLKKYMPEYQRIEDSFMAAIAEKFEFAPKMTRDAVEIDRRMLTTEASVMFTHNDKWWLDKEFSPPFENEWVRDRWMIPMEDSRGSGKGTAAILDNTFMPPRQARRLFLERYAALTAALKGVP